MQNTGCINKNCIFLDTIVTVMTCGIQQGMESQKKMSPVSFPATNTALTNPSFYLTNPSQYFRFSKFNLRMKKC